MDLNVWNDKEHFLHYFHLFWHALILFPCFCSREGIDFPSRCVISRKMEYCKKKKKGEQRERLFRFPPDVLLSWWIEMWDTSARDRDVNRVKTFYGGRRQKELHLFHGPGPWLVVLFGGFGLRPCWVWLSVAGINLRVGALTDCDRKHRPLGREYLRRAKHPDKVVSAREQFYLKLWLSAASLQPGLSEWVRAHSPLGGEGAAAEETCFTM